MRTLFMDLQNRNDFMAFYTHQMIKKISCFCFLSFINLWVWLPGLLCPLHNHIFTTGITGWWTANKARQSSSYIIYSFIYFCMRNTRWKSPANRAPVSPWKRQRRLYTKCLNISKQSLSFVSYTSAIKHTNLKWKINSLGSIDS